MHKLPGNVMICTKDINGNNAQTVLTKIVQTGFDRTLLTLTCILGKVVGGT